MTKKRKEATEHLSPSKKRKEPHHVKSEFRLVNSSLLLSVPPVFSANPLVGVQEMLDSMVMRYHHSLQGVVLSHSNITFVENVARIQRDCPFLVCNIKFDAIIWSPRIGDTLFGKVNLCSPDHISLLVHRTFNASIPRHHIPTATWEFEYGPAENDPEFGQTAQGDDEDLEAVDHRNNGGKWVHRVTGEVLGGDQSLLEFTVIGLTVANEMLSLLGSLEPDPFSPRHVPHRRPEKDEDSESDGDSIPVGDSSDLNSEDSYL